MGTAPSPLPYDMLIAAVHAAFDAKHPPESLPDWFVTSVAQSQRFTPDKMLKVEWYVHKALELQPNQKWVERNGYEELQELDPRTGEIMIVISPNYGNPVILFSANVNPLTGEVEVLEDMDISSFARDDIAHPRPVRPGPRTDRTQYRVDVVSADVRNDAHLRAVGKLLGINLLAARKALESGQDLKVFSGYASDVISVREGLNAAGLEYRIDPPFPW